MHDCKGKRLVLSSNDNKNNDEFTVSGPTTVDRAGELVKDWVTV